MLKEELDKATRWSSNEACVVSSRLPAALEVLFANLNEHCVDHDTAQLLIVDTEQV